MVDETDDTREPAASDPAAGAHPAESEGVVGAVDGTVPASGAESEHNGSVSVHGNGSEQTLDTRNRVRTKQGGYLTPVRSSEHARELAGRRWAVYRQSAAAEVARAVAAVADADDSARITAARRGDTVAYGLIAGRLAERAYMDADPRAASFVRQAIGADVGAPERNTTTTAVVGDSASSDLAEILAAYRAWKAARASEGEGEGG